MLSSRDLEAMLKRQMDICPERGRFYVSMVLIRESYPEQSLVSSLGVGITAIALALAGNRPYASDRTQTQEERFFAFLERNGWYATLDSLRLHYVVQRKPSEDPGVVQEERWRLEQRLAMLERKEPVE